MNSMKFYDKEDSTLNNVLETDVKTTSHDEHQTKWNTTSLKKCKKNRYWQRGIVPSPWSNN